MPYTRKSRQFGAGLSVWLAWSMRWNPLGIYVPGYRHVAPLELGNKKIVSRDLRFPWVCKCVAIIPDNLSGASRREVGKRGQVREIW